jgi:hypothetical protein
MYKIISTSSGDQGSMNEVAEVINKDQGRILHAFANKYHNIFIYEVSDYKE